MAAEELVWSIIPWMTLYLPGPKVTDTDTDTAVALHSRGDRTNRLLG